jgi:hypothetical protein
MRNVSRVLVARCGASSTAAAWLSDKEREAIEFLRNDSQARIFFINKIAAPVLNKMFDCGMIP